MMNNDTEQIIINRLDKIDNRFDNIDNKLDSIKTDLGAVKERQAGLTTDIGWIKILFTIAAAIFTVLLGALITLLFILLRLLAT